MGCSQSQQAAIKDAAEKQVAEQNAKKSEFAPGAELLRGAEAITSPNGNFKLVHQDDGNVVLYKGEEAKFATGTDGKETTKLIFQEDGNLVLYNGEEALWSSETNGKEGKKVTLQDDGNFVMYTEGGEAVWATNTAEEVAAEEPAAAAAAAEEPAAEEPAAPADGTFTPGTALKRGESLTSTNGRFKLAHQDDGNVVLYHSGEAKFATGTDGQDTTKLVFQNDGNLVLYNDGEALWSSETNGKDGVKVVLQNDRNLVMYTEGGDAVWSTESAIVAPAEGSFTAGDQLIRGASTENGDYKLAHQNDGNVVLYKDGEAKWSTESAEKDTTHFVFQGDGNLVLYNGEEALWSSETNGKDGVKFNVQGDGNLVIYTEGGEAVWSSETAE